MPTQTKVRKLPKPHYNRTMQFLLALSLLANPSFAGDFFLGAGPDQVPSGPDVGGLNWVRVFNNFDDGGWWLTHHWEHEGSPGYNVAPMTEGLAIDMSARIRLDEWEDIKDHGIERCPDGSFLHVYSLSVTNDSARAARYTDDWSMTASGWVEDSVAARAHNDMPVICSEHLQGVAFTNHSDMHPTFFEIGPDATVIATHEIDINTHISGSSFKYDPISDRYLMITNGEPGLGIFWLNRDLTKDVSFNIEPIPSLFRHFWPQGLMRVGDYWLVLFLGEAYNGQYLAGDGDVYIAVLNDDFSTLETIMVSNNVDGDLGSARPSFARHSDQLLVAWDKGFQPYVSVVTLDLVQFGMDEDDSGFVPPDEDEDSPCADTADEDDTPTIPGISDAPGSAGSADELEGDTSDDWDEPRTGEGIKGDRCDEGCGCSSATTNPRLGWGLLVGLLAVARRRR
jgi:MYXO-CTERM domain-containing protein